MAMSYRVCALNTLRGSRHCVTVSSKSHISLFNRALSTNVLKDAQPTGVSGAPSQTPVLKRFWKRVNVSEANGALTIMLDQRVLKTPEGNKIIIPSTKRTVAALVAAEWEAQDKVVKHHALPVTSLVCRTIDTFEEAGPRIDACNDLLRYVDTDTILFHEEYPPQLVKGQNSHWKPLLDWARSEYGVQINIYSSILRPRQPTATAEVFSKVLREMDPWSLAGMERAIYYSKSFIISLALAKGRITAEQAAQATLVEVQSQIDRWGEVEDTHDVDYRDIRRQLASAAVLFYTV